MTEQKETFSLQWNIANFNFLPLKRGEMLKSPAFNLGVSEPLYLEFYPRGDMLESDGESLVVCISRKNLNEYRVGDLYISMTDVFRGFCKTFELVARQYDSLKWVFKPDMKVMAETNKFNLVIKCKFFQIEVPSHIDSEDMEALSKDLETLYINGKFSDLVLTCEGQSFHVHECILSSRIPAFLTDIVTANKPHHDNVKEVNLDIDTLKFILYYIYSGRFLFTSKVPDGVYKIIEMYQMNDLKHSLYFLPQSLVADTCVKIDYIQFKWAIGPELMKIQTTKEVVSPAIPCNLPFKSSFRIVCRYEDKGGQNPVKVRVRRIDFGNASPIFFKLQIHVHHPVKYYPMTNYNTFDCEEEKEFPLIMDEYNESVSLTCHFYVSVGECSSLVKMESHYSDFDHSFLKSRHLNSFCSDIGRLYNIFLPKKSDVSLHVGDVQFPVHKAILSARSCVFSKMFETDMIEKKSGVVKISDIEVEKVNMMLCYMYNGKVSISNCALAMDLYKVADKYELLSLKERCSSFLEKSFGNTDCNPCEVFVFADDHSDEHLKKKAKNYLLQNCRTILKTDNFKNLIYTRPDLASVILDTITDNLDNFVLGQSIFTLKIEP